MENNLKYIVYLTINLQNKKIYVGVHKTNNPYGFDGYIGNGVFISRPSTYERSKTAFQFAVKKYGVKNFKRVILRVFDTLEDALKLESEIVNEWFVRREDTYNLVPGGGLPGDASIEIYQYSLNGDFIKCWKSSVDASKYFNIASNNIRNAIKCNSTCCGYLWTDVYFEHLDISAYKIQQIHEFVYKFDENNKLVSKYKSVKEAATQNKSTSRLILNAIAGKTKSKGFYYSYNENFKIDQSVYNKMTDVYLYNLDGTFYKHFNSPKECCLFFNDVKTSRLYAAERTGGLYKGFQVSKVKLEYMKNIEKFNTPKKVGQYDLNGNLIKVWDTIQSAYLEYGAGVKKCLKSLLNKSKGFVWRYID